MRDFEQPLFGHRRPLPERPEAKPRKEGATRRPGAAVRTALGLLLPVAVIVMVAGGGEWPRVVNPWPLLMALGLSALAWWVQALIYAVLARSKRRAVRVGAMFRVEMAGLFVALVSPVKGAELPYKAYLIRRLGFSAWDGSSVVITRVLLDAAVLTPAAFVSLALYGPSLPEVRRPDLLPAGLLLFAAAATVAVALLARKVAARKVSRFLREARRSFASYWRPGCRATLVYATALAALYWVLRLSAAPLALVSVGWSGDWVPVVVAQLLLASFVLPLSPTPGGGGVRELGLAALLSGHVPQEQLLGGLVIYAALAHWLPLVASAFFVAHELRRGGAPASRAPL